MVIDTQKHTSEHSIVHCKGWTTLLVHISTSISLRISLGVLSTIIIPTAITFMRLVIIIIFMFPVSTPTKP